jgi:hypothetical protein
VILFVVASVVAVEAQAPDSRVMAMLVTGSRGQCLVAGPVRDQPQRISASSLPSLIIGVPNGRSAKAPDGRLVLGLGFTASSEQGKVRVTVWPLLARHPSITDFHDSVPDPARNVSRLMALGESWELTQPTVTITEARTILIEPGRPFQVCQARSIHPK